ncbi:hypothetical protein HYFRA_00005360 [Hymenoscyphus fraxineus]|uniref:Mitochondrial outer membrane protein OM14 C-terminal domain-containing protein n=1 Tax=Hymenoscyphus fraxineus TaxID=746836 RepID=A0A9N9L8D2_9HELO|nr:hypothetical protein HYFRA_00005360 [Hymenoscyphus fraxineus]
MSYASVAASGPAQSPEEKRAPPQPEIESVESISTSSLVDVDSESVHTVPSDFESQTIKTDTQADRLEREAIAAEAHAKAEVQKASNEASKKAKEAKAKGKRAVNNFEENSDNPVFIANAIAVVGLSAGLGFGAYRKYAAGELTWKVVGAWAGVVGLFAAGDFYLSQYLFKNKYPKK